MAPMMFIKRFRHVVHGSFLLALLSVSLAIPACTVAQPPPENSGTVERATGINCASQILQAGISEAVSRSNSIIAAGPTVTAAKKNLLGLVASLTAPAVACGLQYLTGKLAFDASHAPDPQLREEYDRRAEVAREFIREQGYTFAGDPPN